MGAPIPLRVSPQPWPAAAAFLALACPDTALSGDDDARALPHDRWRADALDCRHITHGALFEVLDPRIDACEHLSRHRVGRSVEGRPLELVRFGDGPTRVFVFSQVHGNESTGTRALTDLICALAEAPDDGLAGRLAEGLTLFALPMVNPDGAEIFRRRNAQAIDINRDGREPASPEGQALWSVFERVRPGFAISLHDEQVLKQVDDTGRQVAASLLAPLTEPDQSHDEAPEQSRQLAAVVHDAIRPLVDGHVTRYPASYNRRTFDGRMQRAGATTLLFETAGWRDDPQKEHLRLVCRTGLLAALDAAARGTLTEADPAGYDVLPSTGKPMVDLLLRGGHLVVGGGEPYRADVVVDFDDPIERRGGTIVDVGDPGEVCAFETLDCTGRFLHAMQPALRHGAGEDRGDLAIGRPASFIVREGPALDSRALCIVDAGRIADLRPK